MQSQQIMWMIAGLVHVRGSKCMPVRVKVHIDLGSQYMNVRSKCMSHQEVLSLGMHESVLDLA